MALKSFPDTNIHYSTCFLDGDKIPCILIQNKCDLINESEYNKCDEINKKSCNENGFIGCFMTSVKEGNNVNEAMDFLIEKILDRMEKYANNGNIVFSDQKRRNTIKLKNSSNRTSVHSTKDDNGCCSKN